jgi:hypothetical protein
MIHNHDKKVPLDLYDQIIDDHIIFTNVVSIKNTDFQFYIFWGVTFNNNIHVLRRSIVILYNYSSL